MNQVINLKNVHPEVRAFIYQQIADIELLVPEGASITILIDDHDKSNVLTTIKVATPYGEIEANEGSTDIYRSLAKTKSALLNQLGEIQRASSDDSDSSELGLSVDQLRKMIIH